MGHIRRFQPEEDAILMSTKLESNMEILAVAKRLDRNPRSIENRIKKTYDSETCLSCLQTEILLAGIHHHCNSCLDFLENNPPHCSRSCSQSPRLHQTEGIQHGAVVDDSKISSSDIEFTLRSDEANLKDFKLVSRSASISIRGQSNWKFNTHWRSRVEK